jgi:Mrp family chromosome partitioning ATPase
MRRDSIAAPLAERLAPLLDAAPRSDQAWLRTLLTEPGAYDSYTALDSELFLHDLGPGAPVLVASAARGEGRTTMALVLAVLTAAADPSRRVLAVDADLQYGRLAATLGAAATSPGLAELFAGAAEPRQCVQPTALPNLFVAPRGSEAAGLFSPVTFGRFMQEIAGSFDRVVVDSPARGGNSAVMALAKVVGAAIVVVRYGRSTREQVGSLQDELRHAGARVLGCVLNAREYVVPAALYGAR